MQNKKIFQKIHENITVIPLKIKIIIIIKIIPKTELADLQNDFYEIQQTKVTKAAKITK